MVRPRESWMYRAEREPRSTKDPPLAANMVRSTGFPIKSPVFFERVKLWQHVIPISTSSSISCDSCSQLLLQRADTKSRP
eukprot:scaffold39593_cov176-Amphora_coffeaeformis.AAC.6